jgi:hypothetical protein
MGNDKEALLLRKMITGSEAFLLGNKELLASPAAKSAKELDSLGIYSKVIWLTIGHTVDIAHATSSAAFRCVHLASLFTCLIIGRLSI